MRRLVALALLLVGCDVPEDGYRDGKCFANGTCMEGMRCLRFHGWRGPIMMCQLPADVLWPSSPDGGSR